ncbi:MAG: hypothetical protein WCO23_05075 [bacterium]
MIIFLALVMIIFLLLMLFVFANLVYANFLGAPSIYSSGTAMSDAMKLAGVKKGQLVVDLGCGNAKSLIIAASQFGAKGIGVEKSPLCYLQANLNVLMSRQQRNIKILFGDFSVAEKYLRKADVVYLYLLPTLLTKIEKWLFNTIADKTKVVSLSFEFPTQKSINSIETKNLGYPATVRMYRR